MAAKIRKNDLVEVVRGRTSDEKALAKRNARRAEEGLEPLKPGGEEYINSEKYEYRPRDFNAEPNLNGLIAHLNRIRKEHPALQQL